MRRAQAPFFVVGRTDRPEIDKATLFRLAAEASCDPRTIQRVYQGKKVRGLAGDRALKVLTDAGLLKETEAAANE